MRSCAGCSARVRYSRLNEAARAADAGLMEIGCREGVGVGMRRDCVAEHTGSRGASGKCLLGENIAKRATEEAERTDFIGDKADHDGRWRSTQEFVDGESYFMRQR